MIIELLVGLFLDQLKYFPYGVDWYLIMCSNRIFFKIKNLLNRKRKRTWLKNQIILFYKIENFFFQLFQGLKIFVSLAHFVGYIGEIVYLK